MCQTVHSPNRNFKRSKHTLVSYMRSTSPGTNGVARTHMRSATGSLFWISHVFRVAKAESISSKTARVGVVWNLISTVVHKSIVVPNNISSAPSRTFSGIASIIFWSVEDGIVYLQVKRLRLAIIWWWSVIWDNNNNQQKVFFFSFLINTVNRKRPHPFPSLTHYSWRLE